MTNSLSTVKALSALAAMLLLSAAAMAQTASGRPYVLWPDHNYAVSNPPAFEPDKVCGQGQNPFSDFCWAPIEAGGLPIFDPARDASPAGTDIIGSAADETTSLYFAFDDLSGYPQAIRDQLPGGVLFIRMRLRQSPLSNNVNPTRPYASSAAWHFLFDIEGDGFTNFISRVYGVDDRIQIIFNDLTARQITPSTAELNTQCGPNGVLLWDEPTALVNFPQPLMGNIEVPIPLGCTRGGGNNRDRYCNFGYTRVVNKDVDFPAEGALLDMQFPMYAFRSCRSGDLFTPPGGGKAVRGDLLFESDQPFLVCASTGTQTNDIFAKDFAITSPAGFTPTLTSALACSDPCTLEGGCEPGLLLIEAGAQCTANPNGSPVTLTAQVMATNVLQNNTVVSSVREISFEYWQEGVSTGWTPIQTLTAPTTGLNQYSVQWDTSNFDVSLGSFFQIRVTGTDIYEQELEETFVRIDLTDEGCDDAGIPVTLAYVSSQQRGGNLQVEWFTSSELANAGFNIYGETADGSWRRLNRELIPSQVVDSVEPQHYSVSLALREISHIIIEDVDVRGIPRQHGPFEVGTSAGRVPQVERIDWAAIRSEQRAAAVQRGRSWHADNLDPVRVLVEVNGIHRVTYEQLAAQGLDLAGVPVARIALTHAGHPVPFHTAARGRFGPGDWIEFYGRSIDSKYTPYNVYHIHVDGRGASTMPAVAAAVGSGPGSTGARPPMARNHHSETIAVWRQREYSASSLSGSPWYDTRMRANRSARQWHFDFEVENLLSDQPAHLHAQYWGMSEWAEFSPDHHISFSLNGQPLGSDLFDGAVLRTFDIELPAGMLHEGENRLTVRMPGDTGAPWHIVGFDGFRVTYARRLLARDGYLRFEASAGAPYRVEGLRTATPVVYRIKGDEVVRLTRLQVEGQGPYSVILPDPQGDAVYVIADQDRLLTAVLEPGRAQRDIVSGRADYLMISHPSFIEGLAPLVAFHEAQGRSVRVVDVFDIYDQFSGGVKDPYAIQAYIRHTAESMGYAHVLLVGGDTYDYRNWLGSNSVSFIPSIYTDTSVYVQFTPSDALFVDLSRNGVPDLPIGRLPVRTAAELDEVIRKTLQFADRNYRQSVLFVADRQEPGLSFTQSSQRLLNAGMADWALSRAYLDWMPVDEARQTLMQSIDAGVSLTSFVGHSAFSNWTFSGLFSSADVANLSNFGRPTAVVQFGCWNTYHVVPSFNTLGHSFLLTPDRGAAVVVGSSTWTAANSADAIGERLFALLGDGRLTIGEALNEAKRDLARTHPHMRDAILGWTILGDPAIVIGD